ncbi:unnamed protein product [Porites lobata]|uniref:Uncharacterized protein n=1 Tax=Porites lobata TaxID=104759 RepID=A0ABN8P505_9CNID|nr:unnamed protein product [Porites lobata]
MATNDIKMDGSTTLDPSLYVLIMFSILQNSPYFCVFKYVRAVKQKVWNDADNRERETYATLYRFLYSF